MYMDFINVIKNCSYITITYDSPMSYSHSLELSNLIQHTVYDKNFNVTEDVNKIDVHIPFILIKRIKDLYSNSYIPVKKYMYKSDLVINISNNKIKIIKSRYSYSNDVFNLNEIGFLQRKQKIKKILKKINQ